MDWDGKSTCFFHYFTKYTQRRKDLPCYYEILQKYKQKNARMIILTSFYHYFPSCLSVAMALWSLKHKIFFVHQQRVCKIFNSVTSLTWNVFPFRLTHMQAKLHISYYCKFFLHVSFFFQWNLFSERRRCYMWCPWVFLCCVGNKNQYWNEIIRDSSSLSCWWRWPL